MKIKPSDNEKRLFDYPHFSAFHIAKLFILGFDKTKLYYDVAVNRLALTEIKGSGEYVKSTEKR